MICVFSTTFRMRYIDDCIYEKLFFTDSFLLGCSGNKKENTLQDEEGTPVINLSSDNVSKVALLPLSEAAAKVEIVSLEVTDESLIGEITKMKVTDSDIWVKHYKDNHVLRFSRSGKFLNKVGKVGQGPEEYIRMADFFVDENTKEVYIQTTIVGLKSMIMKAIISGQLQKHLRMMYL